MMNKRAQAAMEFLMTYGWAILVVLVVIGALAYFGILNPDTLLPEKCQIQMGLYCKDHLVTTDGTSKGSILLALENGRGSDIMVTNLTATTNNFGATVNCTWGSATGKLLRNGAQGNYTLDDGGFTGWCEIPADYQGQNSKIKWDLELLWFSLATGKEYTHTARGELMAVVE
jgi:uncharacterized protein (UPF0333 family)